MQNKITIYNHLIHILAIQYRKFSYARETSLWVCLSYMVCFKIVFKCTDRPPNSKKKKNLYLSK